jgi:hypothetical protein
MVQVVPQFQINQIFEQTPDATTNALRALVIGPDYAVRNDQAIGAYAGIQSVVAWPGRQAGDVVDLTSPVVSILSAAQRYANVSTVGTQSVSGRPNRISNAAVSWSANGAFPRSGVVPADVKPDDWIRLTAGADVLVSRVLRTVADTVPAVVASPVVVAGLVGATLTSGGTFTGLTSTTYVVTVTRAGSILAGALTPGQVTVTTSTGVDAGGPYNVVESVAIPLGTLGLTLTIDDVVALVLGNSLTIVVTAASTGAVHAIELANSLPIALQAIDLTVELAVVSDIVVSKNRTGHAPLLNWSTAATQLTLAAGILAQHARTGVLDLDVVAGQATVSYRALRTAGANTVVDIATSADVVDAFGGTDVPEAGLSYGLYRALSNAAATTIKAVSVESDDVAGYQKALSRLKEREDFYRIVPLTHDEAVINAVCSAATQRSGPDTGRWATVMFALALNATLKLGEGLAVIADDAAAAGTQYTIVRDTAGLFITKGIRAGDKLRAAYTADGFGGSAYASYTVDAVLSEEEIRLLAGPAAAVTLASKYEVWRELSTSEQVADWGTRTRARSNRRFTSVFPPNPGRAGKRVASYFLACSLAALRGASAPHQGLTNAEVLDWDDLKQASETFGDLLDEAANYGGYIVTQDPSGRVYIRKQLTTDLSDTKKAEDSATVNLDSISYYFKDLLAPKVGRSNVVESNLRSMRTDIAAGIAYLAGASATNALGGQVVSGELVFLRQHATLLDHVVARIQLTLPIPLNNGILDIVV